jgi:hypothetical protein
MSSRHKLLCFIILQIFQYFEAQAPPLLRHHVSRDDHSSRAVWAQIDRHGRRRLYSSVRRAYPELLWMNGAPWTRRFRFPPFAADVFGAYEAGATAILQELPRKHSEHTSMTAGECKRLAFQSLSVALQSTNAGMIRFRRAPLAEELALHALRPGS